MLLIDLWIKAYTKSEDSDEYYNKLRELLLEYLDNGSGQHEKEIKLFGYKDEDDVWTFQRAPYIEDGWYIKEEFTKETSKWHIFEIPTGGGNPQPYKTYDVFADAYETAINLT